MMMIAGLFLQVIKKDSDENEDTSMTLLCEESILQPAQNKILRYKRSAKVNRLCGKCFIVVILVHIIDHIRSSTGMQGTSESKLDVAVLRIWVIKHEAFRRSKVKGNLFPINECDGTGNFCGADLAKEVSPLCKCDISTQHYCVFGIHLGTIVHSLNSPCHFVKRIVCI